MEGTAIMRGFALAAVLAAVPLVSAAENQVYDLELTPDIIAKLDQLATNRLFAEISEHVLDLGRARRSIISIVGGRQNLLVGVTEVTSKAASAEELARPFAPGQIGRVVSEGKFYPRNFALRNDTGYPLSVVVARPSARAFPIHGELEAAQEFVTELELGVYYIAVGCKDQGTCQKAYLRAEIEFPASLSGQVGAYVFNVVKGGEVDYSQAPSFRPARP
jgi:hypothetical protein